MFVYQDHLTKFVIFRALTSKRAAEVAHHLLDISLLIGAPSIPQSDNGSEFTAEVISELKIVWPRLVMVHGKPRHPQSQGSVERANGDIKDMLVAWMGDNDTNDWSVSITFVQFQNNSSYHSGIQRSPYAANRSSCTIMKSCQTLVRNQMSGTGDLQVLSPTTDLVLDSAPGYGGPPLTSPAPVTVSADLLKARIDNERNDSG